MRVVSLFGDTGGGGTAMGEVRRWRVVISTTTTATAAMVWGALYDANLAFLDPHVEPSDDGVRIMVTVEDASPESAASLALSALRDAVPELSVQVESSADAGPAR